MIGPNAGEMAEAGEAGIGRMAEPLEIAAAAERLLRPPQPRPLAGKRVLITAGPTHEPIDPVRYIANRSSGKQGFAIAAAAQAAGADVILISGPVDLDDPPGVIGEACGIRARHAARRWKPRLPADIAIFAAAVADWRVANEGEQKLKKTAAGMPPLQLVENPDILATISKLKDRRPPLVIGFAAETEHLIDNAKAKLARKGCDWIVANDVSPATGVMGGDRNTVHLLTRDGARHPCRFLAGHDQGRSRHRSGGAHRRSRREGLVSANVTGRYQAIAARRRPGAAGLSERARRGARPAGRGSRRLAAGSCARKVRAGADRAYDRAAARAMRRRSVRAPASQPSTASPC